MESGLRPRAAMDLLNMRPSPESAEMSDHLILLVGGNPLPNYVAGQLLLREGGTLHLFHSEGRTGTGRVAQLLAARFPDVDKKLVPVQARDPGSVYRAISEHVEAIKSERIGLHYTGGTKVMAVHAYQAVRGTAPNAVFSHLDADTHELVIEVPTQDGPTTSRHDVLLHAGLGLDDLLALHGIRRVSPARETVRLASLAHGLALLHGTEDGRMAWRDARQLLAPTTPARPWSELRTAMKRAGVPAKLLDDLAGELGYSHDQPIVLDDSAKVAGFKSAKELTDWLAGTWLEEWTLESVRGLPDVVCEASLKLRFDLARNQRQEFEIDVAVLHGYQLLALSCAVSPKEGTAKEKLLEVYTRAHQIGGDEARAAVVCTVEDTSKIEAEMEDLLGRAQRARVFGARDLRDLRQHIAQWLTAV